MEYYTNFDLKVFEKNSNSSEPSLNYEKIISDFVGYNPFIDSCKWDNFRNDMKEISNTYKDVLFQISGVGDDVGDIWKSYFQNGKNQYCKAKITFDDFDESKLY